MSTTKSTFVEKIYSALKSHYKLATDKDLAEFLGIDFRTLSAWKSRGRIAKPDVILYKCRGLRYEWLNTGEGEMFSEYKEPEKGAATLAEHPDHFGPEFSDPVTQAAFELFRDLVKRSPIETARKIMVESLETAEGFTSEQSKGKRAADDPIVKNGKQSTDGVM